MFVILGTRLFCGKKATRKVLKKQTQHIVENTQQAKPSLKLKGNAKNFYGLKIEKQQSLEKIQLFFQNF